jgi:cyclohexanecarboxyl-CoA dehydrogenase
MNPYLDDAHRALREAVRRFASARIAPGYSERDRTRTLDKALMRKMGAMGVIAPELPARRGGQGMGCLASGVIVEEVARADLSLGYVQLLASLTGQILAQYAAPDIAESFVPRVTRGEAVLALALTEPQGGSDAAGARLRIGRRGFDYIVNGEKTSISAADQADEQRLRDVLGFEIGDGTAQIT